jgi:O-antigen ligase
MKKINSNNSIFTGVFLEKNFSLILSFAPLFLLTMRSWSSAFLIIGSILSFIFLLLAKPNTGDSSEISKTLEKLVVITMLVPVCAVAFSSLLRGIHAWADYDTASRFLISIVIFLFAARKRFNIALFLQYTVPLSLIFTLLHQIYFPQPKMWGPDRMSTYFADPLVFGYICLTFSLISLTSINIFTKDSKQVVLFKLLGSAIGLYLSIMSGSRTGWLAAPIAIAIWLYQQDDFKRNNKRLNLLATVLSVAFIIMIFTLSSTVNQRLALALHEVFNYSWIGIAPDTSVGLRITFLRIAFDMFMSNPFIGYGDTSKQLILLPKNIYTYASPESIHIAFTAGFHNEIITNSIRYGLAGLISSSMLFIVPLLVFIHHINSTNKIRRANALIGIVFTICVMISSFSTEVFDLKYTASFYAFTIALLCASTLAAKSKNIKSTQPKILR